MRFIIKRTSGCYNKKPCKEAFKIKVPKVTKNGYVTRQEEDVDVWAIEIKTVKDLISLYEKYGELILCRSYVNCDYFGLEIYDDYRE